ncbi:hypothetical protein B0H14DRAFT_2679809 [Mycena olivaceomarginata]|nr:hypothetical protein B0H14DRAFT_2679809 [Mycena olivaceomarginata]
MSKKRKTRTPNRPSPAEWAKMIPYGTFSVADDQGQPLFFTVGDTASVLPNKTTIGTRLPANRYWHAKILAIRARRQSSLKSRRSDPVQTRPPDVWVQINWFYSPTQISYGNYIPGFRSGHCSKFERIYSDHLDCISALAFVAVTPMIKFRQDDPDQQPILDELFYYRYHLQTTTHSFSMQVYSRTDPDDVGLCGLCRAPYDVKNTDPLHIMHMCPRPNCRCFYHRSCLLEEGYWGPTTDPLLRISSSPDELLSKTQSVGFEAMNVPLDLLTLAGQPIVRGAGLPALGITGNSRDVVYARRLVYAAMQGTAVPDAWEDHVDIAASLVSSHLHPIQLEETGDDLMLACPNCHGPI